MLSVEGFHPRLDSSGTRRVGQGLLLGWDALSLAAVVTGFFVSLFRSLFSIFFGLFFSIFFGLFFALFGKSTRSRL